MTSRRERIANLEAERNVALANNKTLSEQLDREHDTVRSLLDISRARYAADGVASEAILVETREAILAVAVRLEERAKGLVIRKGIDLDTVEDFRTRATILRDALGETTDDEEHDAHVLLSELISATR